jgi:hypothetical protein
MKKLTKKDYYLTAINFLNAMVTETVATVKEQEITTDDLSDFFSKEVALLEKKNSGNSNRKLTPQQETNEKIKQAILDYMEENGGKYTITEMMSFPVVNEVEPPVSNQRVSALVRQLLDESEELTDETKPLKKVVEKRKSYFEMK